MTGWERFLLWTEFTSTGVIFSYIIGFLVCLGLCIVIDKMVNDESADY